MKRISLTLLAGLMIMSVRAQEVSDDAIGDESELKRYSVEVIIFRYEEDVYSGSEVFRPDPPVEVEEPIFDEDGNPLDDEIPVYTDADAGRDVDEDVELPPHWIIVPSESESAIEVTPDDEQTEINPFQLVLSSEDEYMLGGTLRQFELLDAYETLMHVAWTQPAYSEDETPPIELALFGELPDGLDGTLTLYLSRYLHLVVDLTLDAPDTSVEEAQGQRSFFDFGDSRFGYEEPEPPRPVRWRIQENRIFKNGDLRYFDHPKFGVLAKVVRVEEDDSDDDAQDALLGSFSQ